MNQLPRRHFLKTGASLTAVAASAGLLAACGGGSDVVTPAAPTQSIVQIASADARFSTLVAALGQASLVTALSGAGPFTVFAPTNAAFDALRLELGGGTTPITVAALLANPKLADILQYHVVGAKVLKAGIPLGKAIDPILAGSGDIFKIDAVGSKVEITDGRNRKSNISATDILATNGVIHVIDKVILPADKDIVATALASNPEFSTLVTALQTASLVTALQAAGPFTVFAPTNAAFDALRLELGGGTTPITVAALLANAKLADILKYHVIASRVLKADITAGAAVTTLQGETLSISAAFAITDQRPARGTAGITATDILTSNGVIHVIDKVILPKP